MTHFNVCLLNSAKTSSHYFSILFLHISLVQPYLADLTSIIHFGSSFALYSCNIQSNIFFQPSRSMSPCRWASENTVFAANLALLFIPNETGMFSGACGEQGHVRLSLCSFHFILTYFRLTVKIFTALILITLTPYSSWNPSPCARSPFTAEQQIMVLFLLLVQFPASLV